MSNAPALIKPSTTTNFHDVIKPTRRLILLGLKPRKANSTPIHSNVQTVRANIKLIPLTVHSRNIGSTRNGIPKNMPKFKKIESNQFVQL